MGSPVRIDVLGWSDTLADYGLFLVMAYLTKWWEFNFRHAAAIVNVFWGFTAILPIPIRFFRNCKSIPDRWMVFIPNLAYSLGLGLLLFSSLEKKHKDIKVREKQMTSFYASLPLIAVAKSGYVISLQKLIDDEIHGVVDIVKHKSMRIGVTFLINILGLTISYLMKQWSTRFEIPALCMAVATLIFLTGFRSYGRESTGLFTKLCNIVLKLLIKIVNLMNAVLDFCKNIAFCPLRLLCCCFFKKTQESEQNNDTISRIDATKFIISLFPICLLGLISSLGNTYFLEQAYSMNQKIGFFKVPYVLLLSMYKLGNYLLPKLYFETVDSCVPSCCTSLKKALNRIGMVLSLLCALLCCVIAGGVESKRIEMTKGESPVEMHMLYLVPQFFLLGGLYGLAFESIERFFKDHQTPQSLEPYMVDSTVGVFGLGNIGSVLLVYLVSKYTAKNGTSWFDKTINTSRLDKYYWLLSVWITINIVWYLLVSILCRPKEKSATPPRSSNEKEKEDLCHSLAKLARKCCIFLKCLPEKVPDCCCFSCCCCCCSNSGDPRKNNYRAEQLAT
ncbi:protein NRT1/ PTR FAMILY 5.5-like [Humulus lupulus]|uniref:protein NRT1/ PTR FAMILY 5.5-like n=1 Tax=Humulus lupulus TaxID=3486 RepID=UPI002B40E647|nr:protein NRT1/ PTR FAMILY 5.5-like [Humulus lupulus]